MSADQSFAPVHDARARVLILGSLPGKRSIAEQGYYAHPRNAFWPIMTDILGLESPLDYAARLAALRAAGIALWDVVAAAERPGSLDSAIVKETVDYNPIPALIAQCPELQLIAFNGGAAAELFARAERQWGVSLAHLERVRLPSTSPANAALSLDNKRRQWHDALVQRL